MAIGADFIKAMEPGLETKRIYAKRHGYALHIGGQEVWDRTRPIPWSKLRYILQFIDQYDYLFWSDADVIITNPDISITEHILPRLPANKDLLWTQDVVGNINSGNMLLRGKSQWLKDFLQRTYMETDLIYHIWWENAAMIRLFQKNVTDAAKIALIQDFTLFNTYLFGPQNKADDPNARLFRRGDFLIHFAGVADQWNIYRMMKYMNHCLKSRVDHDVKLLDNWYTSPMKSQKDADASLASMKIYI
jgi:hypothetical protein